MTGFSPEWLALREPADRSSRNRVVLETCRLAFAEYDELSVCDLGAGTGASLRAFAELLPRRQHWTLVDHDGANLAAAARQLAAWADRVRTSKSELVLWHGAIRIDVKRVRRDLAPAPCCWPSATKLVAASALFDLVSEGWIGRFIDGLAADRLPLLATLTFDGSITLDPPHRLDAAIAEAFRAHQERDKGFGPAAGWRAGEILAARLGDAGYKVTVGTSPWQLGPQDERLRAAFLDGVVVAVGETGMLDSGDIAAWRLAGQLADTVTVGHLDVFAVPPHVR